MHNVIWIVMDASRRTDLKPKKYNGFNGLIELIEALSYTSTSN